MKAILGPVVVVFGGLVSGCATSVDMGPGYYHYDTRAAASPPAVVQPAVTYQEPAVVYREPTVVYQKPAVVYREPTVVYRDAAVVYYAPSVTYRAPDAVFYKDHGQ